VRLFAAFLALLSHQHHTGRARLWLLPILMFGWVNLHLGFVAGLALIAGYVWVEGLEMVWPGRREPALERLRQSWPWLIAAFGATLVNPWGWEVYGALLRQESAMAAQLAERERELVATNERLTVIASTLNAPTSDTLKLAGATTGLAFFFDANAQFIDVLWRTDGTVSATFPLGSVKAVGSMSSFLEIAVAGALAYFTPYDPVIGTELSVTDGTVSGTRSLKNIAVSAENGSSSPSGFTGAAGKVLFSAFPGANNSRQLWTTDGTSAGTTLLVDVAPNDPVHGIGQSIGVGGHTLLSGGTAAAGTEGIPRSGDSVTSLLRCPERA